MISIPFCFAFLSIVGVSKKRKTLVSSVKRVFKSLSSVLTLSSDSFREAAQYKAEAYLPSTPESFNGAFGLSRFHYLDSLQHLFIRKKTVLMDFKNDLKQRNLKNEELKQEVMKLKADRMELLAKTKELKYERNLILTQLMASKVSSV